VLRDLDALYRKSLKTPLAPLLSGREVIEVLDIDPGPEVGRVLGKIRDLQEGGTLSTREDALAFLDRLRKKD
jgi:hypothetical protein